MAHPLQPRNHEASDHPIFEWFQAVHERGPLVFSPREFEHPRRKATQTTTKAAHCAILFTLTLCLNSKSPFLATTRSAYEAQSDINHSLNGSVQ